MSAPVEFDAENRARLARHFACQTPERQRWHEFAGGAQCTGCGHFCGAAPLPPGITPMTREFQPDLFAN